ncbi:putative glutamate carboxypeptidase 2 [Dorcoceras hygrometricum]|uniref:Putative glutamate carboxypeptidase 2 n=1 Tax=Dorcoceras hygrometricum TaxID=472368 RepID=A0A2Z7AFQ7_9LAMI|nr:putative glutamate carboxypeptidase 2 [Dorcoceras hygrometricum]
MRYNKSLARQRRNLETGRGSDLTIGAVQPLKGYLPLRNNRRRATSCKSHRALVAQPRHDGHVGVIRRPWSICALAAQALHDRRAGRAGVGRTLWSCRSACRTDSSRMLHHESWRARRIGRTPLRAWSRCIVVEDSPLAAFDLQDVCIAIGSIATLDLPMVVDLIGIYGLKGPYRTLTTTNWFLQALSVIPRGSWGDVARRSYHDPLGKSGIVIPEPQWLWAHG